MRKLDKTKRDRQKVIQAWLDPLNGDEKAVLDAVEKLRAKHNIPTKQIIMQSILFAAQHDGIEVNRPVSMSQITKMFKSLTAKIDNLVESGHMTSGQATQLAQMFESEVRFEDLDPVSRSLASNYTGFVLNDDEDEDDD